MLLEAGFISLFFAPPGFWPGLGRAHPPSRVSYFLLQWEWFRIYFESGVVKLASGDPEWRNFTAMDEYYQNGPLPTWIGWYVQHLPHWFQASQPGATLVMELGLVWMLVLPRRWRIVCFFIVTAWQIRRHSHRELHLSQLPGAAAWRSAAGRPFSAAGDAGAAEAADIAAAETPALSRWQPRHHESPESAEGDTAARPRRGALRRHILLRALKLALTSVMLFWIFYATTVQMIWILLPRLPLPTSPVAALEPFRIANRYGLFAVMTAAVTRSSSRAPTTGRHWVAYPFRYKPQDSSKAPSIYAPYQPRFEWNLWFASLGTWRDNLIVPSTEVRLLTGDPMC